MRRCRVACAEANAKDPDDVVFKLHGVVHRICGDGILQLLRCRLRCRYFSGIAQNKSEHQKSDTEFHQFSSIGMISSSHRKEASMSQVQKPEKPKMKIPAEA